MKTRVFPENNYPILTYLNGVIKGKGDPLDLRRVLDYGCGDGNVLRTSKPDQLEQMESYRGIDVDSNAVDWFKANLRSWESAAKCKDIEVSLDTDVYSPAYNPDGSKLVSELFENEETYTTIVCYSVLSHLPLTSAITTINRLSDRLAPGGRAFFSFCEINEPTTFAWFMKRRLEYYGSVSMIKPLNHRFQDYYLINNEFRADYQPRAGLNVLHYVSFFPMRLLTEHLDYAKFNVSFALVPGWPQTCLVVQRSRLA